MKADMEQAVRFGVIGTSNIMRSFLRAAFTCEGFRLAAVCSRSLKRGAALAAEFGMDGVPVFEDPSAMAQSGLIDAVYIASPTALHFTQASLFPERGIAVLCEKPFVTNSREAEALLAKAEENRVLVMEAVRSLAMPGFLAIKEAVGKLGRIRRMTAAKCQYSSRYDRFKAGVIENAFRPELSNGALMDIGRYCVAPAVELFGMPDALTASAQFLSTGVDAQGTAVLRYPDMDAVLLYSKVSDSLIPFEIQGESGTLTAEDIYEFQNARITYRDGSVEDLTGSDPAESGTGGGGDGAAHVGKMAMTYEIREFIRCFLEGRTESSLIRHEQTLRSIRIMDDIRKQIGLFYPAD